MPVARKLVCRRFRQFPPCPDFLRSGSHLGIELLFFRKYVDAGR